LKANSFFGFLSSSLSKKELESIMKKFEIYFPLKSPYFITQYFGQNFLPIYKELGLIGHNGIDISCVIGTPVYASHDGQVVYAGQDTNEGIGIVVRTSEQYLDINNNPQFFKSLYWHLLPNVVATVGQKIRIGDLLGYADTTGLAGGSHLHFGLKPQYQGENEWTWWNSEVNNGYKGAIDPLPFLIKDIKGKYIEAYNIKTNLQSIAEAIQKLSGLVAQFLKNLKK